MKKSRRLRSHLTYLFLGLISSNVFAQKVLRLDTGLYTATDLPAQGPVSSSANVTHKYARFGYSTNLPKEITLSTYGEYLEVQMNNFSQPTAKEGAAQKGLAEAGFDLSRGIYNFSDWYNLGLGVGMSAPGFGYNSQAFNAPGQGFTSYIFSLDNYFSIGDFGIGLNLKYKERPGSNGDIEAPEQFIYDLNASYFYESHFLTINWISLRAQSGIDLGGAKWTATGSKRFPVVKEASDTAIFTYGYLLADGHQIDLNFSIKTAVDNTDGGNGFNLGYSYTF